MVSRRDIRCGGQVCPCSSARWHAKEKIRVTSKCQATASRSWGAVRVFRAVETMRMSYDPPCGAGGQVTLSTTRPLGATRPPELLARSPQSKDPAQDKSTTDPRGSFPPHSQCRFGNTARVYLMFLAPLDKGFGFEEYR